MLRRRGKVKHEWADWSGEESWRTYFGLGAEHRIADVTQVAVGIERGALDLKVSILLRARARHENLRFSLEFSVAGTFVWLHPDAEAGEVQVLGVVQRQAGVVGVLQSVLQLHLHRQAPPGAADHVRLLSVGRE